MVSNKKRVHVIEFVCWYKDERYKVSDKFARLIEEKLNELNLFAIKNRQFVRQFQNGATKLDMDGNGRVLLPKDLQEFAGISKEVVLFAYADRIEIWDKAKYDEVMNEEIGDFAALAEEVMSDSKEDEKR